MFFVASVPISALVILDRPNSRFVGYPEVTILPNDKVRVARNRDFSLVVACLPSWFSFCSFGGQEEKSD